MENQSPKKVSEIRKNDQQVEKLLLVLAFMMYLFRMQLSPPLTFKCIHIVKQIPLTLRLHQH